MFVTSIYSQTNQQIFNKSSLVSFYDKVNEVQSLCFKNSMVLTVALTLYLQLQIFHLKCEFVSLTHFFLSLPSMLCCLACVFDFCSLSNGFPYLLQQQPRYKSNLSVQNTTTHKTDYNMFIMTPTRNHANTHQRLNTLWNIFSYSGVVLNGDNKVPSHGMAQNQMTQSREAGTNWLCQISVCFGEVGNNNWSRIRGMIHCFRGHGHMVCFLLCRYVHLLVLSCYSRLETTIL